MDLRKIDPAEKDLYNSLVTHVIQSWEWGEFRQKLGLPLLRYGLYKNNKLISAFQLTLHKIPFSTQFVGYMPKGPLPDRQLAEVLTRIGKENDCAFIKLEPDVEKSEELYEIDPKFQISPKPLFTKYNFVLDLTPSEEDLLKNLHPKARYNIRLAQKKGVTVEIRDDDKAFEMFLKLYFETTARQKYYGHDESYHRKAWKTLRDAGMAKVAIAIYNKKPLTAWMLLNFNDTLYYPYGGSSIEHKDVMANNLVAWEAIRYGQSLGLKKFDMWGALGPDADPKDPWFGFHDFKRKYGGKLVEYIGTYDLVFNDPLYWMFTFVDKSTALKVFLLKLIGK